MKWLITIAFQHQDYKSSDYLLGVTTNHLTGEQKAGIIRVASSYQPLSFDHVLGSIKLEAHFDIEAENNGAAHSKAAELVEKIMPALTSLKVKVSDISVKPI